MSTLREMYRTKNLASNGAFIIISGFIILVLGFFITDSQPKYFKEQISTLNGFKTKYNDQAVVADFFQSIKSNDGFLVLGTSESTSLKGGNFYDFLNQDDTHEQVKFSVLAGAGRTCSTHIPLLLHHKNDIDSLKLIYFINPVYWRTDLSKLNTEYWNRYTSYQVCSDLDLSANRGDEYLKPVLEYKQNLNWFERFVSKTEYVIRAARKNYFDRLYFHLNPEQYTAQFRFFSDSQRKYSDDPNYGKPPLETVDTVWNTSKTFTQKNRFRPIDKTHEGRYEELGSFINLCQELDLQATFILGPYNEKFIDQVSPKSLPDYKETTKRIKQILVDEKVDFVDATDISSATGAFSDHQHHSSYGAYLIYLKLNNHLYEKETN